MSVWTVGTKVMAPIGQDMHRGVVADPPVGHRSGNGEVCVAFTPPVPCELPNETYAYITCKVERVTAGWV